MTRTITRTLALQLLVASLVMADIRFTLAPRSTGVLLGQDLLLDCVAVETSGEALEISWQFDGFPTDLPKLANNSLYIGQVSRAHLGEYTCVANTTSPPITSAQSTPASVIKSCIEDFVSQPESVSVYNGTAVQLECISGFSAPPAVVSWEKNGIEFTEGEQVSGMFGSVGKGGALKTSMKLDLLATTDREGLYVCVARNMLTQETIRSTPANLTVLIRPEAPTITPPPTLRPIGAASQAFTLPCIAAGFPQPEVNWYVDTDNGSALIIESDRIQKWDNGSLHFDALLEEDGGMYKCIATNMLGDATSDVVLLTVAVLDVDFVGPPTDLAVLGGQPVTLHCVPPRSVPPARIIWYHRGDVFEGRLGEFAARVLHDGSLHFESVQITDEGRYFCVAVNDFAVPSSRTSPPANITVHAAPLITEPPVPQRIIKGHLLTLTCGVQGRPVPIVTWFKDNEILGRGDRTTFQTGRLLVRNTNKVDQGMYRCNVTNNLGNSSSAPVLVFIVVPPQIVNPPRDAIKREGTEVLVQCRVYGDPKPTITWTKNGTELAGGGRVSITDEGVILRGVKAQDEGTYTCHAVNEAGTREASATLRIEVKPVLVTYPDDIRVIEMQPLALYCHGTGYPPPHYYWMYNGSQMLPKEFDVKEGGRQLEILSVGRGQSGSYTCVVENDAGSDSHTTSVLVIVPPQISAIFGDLAIDQGEDLHLTCDVSGSPQPLVTWSFNWVEIHATVNSPITFPAYNELRIRFARGDNSGRYQCEAENRAGTDKTNIKVYVRETPFPPVLTSIQAVSMTSVNLTWQAAKQDPENNLTSFVVQYKRSLYFSFITYRDDVPATLRSVEVDGLHPFTQYLFRVASRNNIGTGIYSAPLGTRTLESAPSAPRNLKMFRQNATSMSLQWELPADTNGIIRAYQVHFRQKYRGVEFQVEQIDTPSKSVQQYMISDLNPYTTYEVKVRAATIERGDTLWGEFSKPIDITTPAAPPSAPPPGIKVRVLSSRAIRVTWQPLPTTHHQGVLRSYIVQYRRQTVNQPYADKILSVSDTSTDITGLLPWRWYEIRMTTANQKGKGAISDVTSVRTEPEAPSGRPRHVQVTSMTSTSVSVRWQSIPEEERNSDISGYLVEYENAQTDESAPLSREIGDPAANSMNLTGLLPYTKYRVRVLGYTTQLVHGFGPSSASILVTTKQGFAGPVQNLSVTAFSTSVLLTWEAPETSNGIISNYVVTYYVVARPQPLKLVGTSPPRLRREVAVLVGVNTWEVITNATNVTVTGLRPEATYDFWVVAETAAGRTDRKNARSNRTIVLPPPPFVTLEPTLRPPKKTTIRVTVSTSAMTTIAATPVTVSGAGETNNLPIIVGASVGGGVVLLTLIVIAIVCCYRRAKHKSGVYYVHRGKLPNEVVWLYKLVIPPTAFAQNALGEMQIGGSGGGISTSSSANTSDSEHEISQHTTGSSDPDTQTPSSKSGTTGTTSTGTHSSIAIREGRPGPSLTNGSSATSRPRSEAATMSGQFPRSIPVDPMVNLNYTSLDDLRMAQLLDNQYRGVPGIYLVPPQVGIENPAFEPSSFGDNNSGFSPHTDSTFMRSSTVYTSQHDLYAQMNLSKRRKNRMKSQTAAAIAAQKTATSSMFLDTDALIKNDSVVVYDERTAL